MDETKLDFLLKESRTKILNDIPTGVSIFTFNCFNEPTETPNYYNENIRKDEKLFIQIVKNYIIKIIDLGFTREIEEEEEKKIPKYKIIKKMSEDKNEKKTKHSKEEEEKILNEENILKTIDHKSTL